MGYTIDRDYYQTNRNHKKIVAGCIVLIIFGFTVRAFGALYKKNEWEKMTRELNERRKLEGASDRKQFATKEDYVAHLVQVDKERQAYRMRQIRNRLKPEDV